MLLLKNIRLAQATAHRLRARALVTGILGLLLLGFAAGCPADAPLPTDFPNQPGGNPLVPKHALLPYPSSFYLESDTDTNTGYRLSIPQEALPPTVPAEIFTHGDGFSMAPIILAWLPGGFDPATLPDPTEADASLQDDSPAFLLKVVGGSDGTPLSVTRVAALIEIDLMTEILDKQALIMRAQQKLDPDTEYVVVLTNRLRRQDGGPHVAGEAFTHLRDGKATADPAVEKQRASFDLYVNPAIEQLTGAIELGRTDVVLAWSFRTRSEEQVVSTVLATQRMAWEEPAGDYTITGDATDGENRIIDGVFEAPSFLDADGYIQYEPDGSPRLQGRRDVEFKIVIPNEVVAPRPVILFGHGFFYHTEEIEGGAVNSLCRQYNYSAVATNLGFNEVDGFDQIEVLATRIQDVDWVISMHIQKLANQTALARLTRDRLAHEITHDAGDGTFLPLAPAATAGDATDAGAPHGLVYSGISNGGTFGMLLAATSPAARRFACIVGGGGLTHFLQRAVNWWSFKFFFDTLFPDPLDMQLLMALLQLNFDPIDSINYSHRLVHNRFPGLPQDTRVSLHMALNDSQVRNILTEWSARTAGVPMITPSPKDIWGLETITAPAPDGHADPTLRGALFVYDEHLLASPDTNVPPLEDNGTHGSVPRLPDMQEQWYQFLEFGRFVQVCDGACDPD